MTVQNPFDIDALRAIGHVVAQYEHSLIVTDGEPIILTQVQR